MYLIIALVTVATLSVAGSDVIAFTAGIEYHHHDLYYTDSQGSHPGPIKDQMFSGFEGAVDLSMDMEPQFKK